MQARRRPDCRQSSPFHVSVLLIDRRPKGTKANQNIQKHSMELWTGEFGSICECFQVQSLLHCQNPSAAHGPYCTATPCSSKPVFYVFRQPSPPPPKPCLSGAFGEVQAFAIHGTFVSAPKARCLDNARIHNQRATVGRYMIQHAIICNLYTMYINVHKGS